QLREVQSVEASDDSTVDDYENELSEYDTHIETLKEQKSKSENDKLFKAARYRDQHYKNVLESTVKLTTSRCFTSFLESRNYTSEAIFDHQERELFQLNDKGERVYTSKKVGPVVNSTQSAHPAKFSLIDQYSSQRLKLKRRYRLLLTQTPFTKC
ncbi:unnamed protein product, partial [Adineta steineri]